MTQRIYTNQIMQTSTKIIFNTIILYVKVVLSLAISLISVPLVLRALGASDYGLYNLVAGVVAMLAFLNNSMTVSSQRFMSVAMGEKNEEKINSIYNTSFLLHLFLGILVVIAFEIIGFFAIERLNIPSERIWCANVIFQFLILSTFSKITAVPFDALINAKEDMLVFSIIELTDSLLMLAVALSITFIPGDRLIFYGMCVALISILTFFVKYGWCKKAYNNYSIELIKYKGKFRTKEMLGFTGWNLFGGLAMIARNQGVAVIINLFLGTITNAAYGIANQINGAIGSFSSTFQKAINPQLMKSEGMNDRNRLIRISYISSKFSVLALALFAIPLILEMDEVLMLWLKDDIPPFTMRLAQCIIILSIVYQYSVGIMSAIQATGKIRNYQITMGTILLTNVPAAYIILKLGYPVYYTTMAFVILEIISLLVRLIMASRLTGMKIEEFLKNVIAPTFIIITIPTLIALIPHFIINKSIIRVIIVCSIYGLLYIILMYRFAFDKNQRALIISKINHLVKSKI